MKLVDLIIIVLLVILVSLLVYFSFIKNNSNRCHNCPYHKNCDKSKCFSNSKDE